MASLAEWLPSLDTQQKIDNFMQALLAKLPYLLGIDEIVGGCTIIAMDPFAVGTFPRQITVALRGDYHQFVMYRGGLGVGVGDEVTVVHLRDGDRYEVLMVGGSTGTPSFLDPTARGQILYGDATPAWALRNIGASASVLYSDGNDPQWGNGFQPTWTNRHDFNLNIRFTAATDNEIIFPWNADVALRFVDWTNGHQYLNFDTAGQERLIVNRGNIDIDFEVDSDNINALFQVDAADDIVNINGPLDWKAGNIIYVPLTGDIQTYVTAAAAGDTLILASGSYTITSTITVNKQLNIIGQGNAGFTTAPVTPGHGTLITCATGGVTAFSITSDNVRIARLSLNMTGNASIGISTAQNLVGIVLSNIDVLIVGTGYCRGIYINSSNAILRDLTFYVSSTNANAVGVAIFNAAGATFDSVGDCFNVTGTAKGTSGAGFAYCFTCFNTNEAHTVTLNLSNSVCRTLAGTVLDAAVASDSLTTNNSIVNCYMCTLDGADYDAYQTGTNILNVGGSVLVNNSISGTVAFRAAMVAGIVESNGVIAGIVAKGAGYTAGADDHTIIVTCTIANITILLPPAASNTGRIYVVKKVDATAFTVIVDGNAAETIDGALTQVLAAQYASITVQCDGTGWWVI